MMCMHSNDRNGGRYPTDRPVQWIPGIKKI
jgi:hypothetical protein